MEKQRRRQTRDFSIRLTGKYVFGAYFNMAQANFVKTIVHILPIVGIGGNYQENQVGKMLHALWLITAGKAQELDSQEKEWEKKLRLNPEKQLQLQKLLFKHFPVLNPMMADVANYRAYLKDQKSKVKTDKDTFEQMRGVSVADCLEMFYLMAVTLNDCRNFYTHKNPYNSEEELKKQYKHQERIAQKLDKVVVASRRVYKEREGLLPTEMEFLTGIDHMHPVVVKDENGQVVKDKNEKVIKQFKEYDDFYFRITGERTINENSKEKAVALSDFGLLYFCVQFLSKPYAKLFMDEARLFEFSPFTDEENIILQEMLCIYRIRMPKPHRIDSKDSKTALAMDIFQELRRCPMKLYNLFDKNAQGFFHDVVRRQNSHTDDVSKRLRHGDRFPHLALRLIDEEGIFKRIRFQLRLGSFRFKFYDKKCIDGRERVRRIQKEINGYGRLQEVNDKRFEKWGDMIQQHEEKSVKLEHEDLYLDLDQFPQDTAESSPYITDRRPAYNIHANRIGLFWEDSQNPNDFVYFDVNKMYMPELKVSDGKAPIKMPAPRAFLSVHELPAMLFYEYLRTQQKEKLPSAEQIIIDCEAYYRRFFNDVETGRLKPFPKAKDFRQHLAEEYPNLRFSDIPQKILLYLCSQGWRYENRPETSQERLLRKTIQHLEEREVRIQRRLERYKEDREQIGSDDNKFEKKGFVDVRHGALARYLAKSLMEWQPSKDGKGHDKLTGINYNVLTSYLATLGSFASQTDETEVSSLWQVMKDANLIDGNNPHPFIGKVLQKCNRNIEELYLHYLEEEIEHIRSCHKNLKEKLFQGLSCLPFVHHERLRYHGLWNEEMRALAGRYESVQLPDGLFTRYILEILQKHYADNADLQKALNLKVPEKSNPNRNITFLISRFYELELHDAPQPYYISDKPLAMDNDGRQEEYSFKRAYELFSILDNKKQLTSDEIQKRLTAKLLDNEGRPIPELGKRGKAAMDTQENIIWQRKIAKEIESYINSLSDKDLKIPLNCKKEKKEEERNKRKEALANRLKSQIKDIKNTERQILRYRTQDMVLFLMAKDAFVRIMDEQGNDVNWDNLCLAKVCDDGFLRQAFTFQIPVLIGDETIYIEQENMSMVNYGELRQILADDRLESLLKNIAENIEPNTKGKKIIRYTDLMSELAAYDRIRSTVFKLIQQIEQFVLDKFDYLADPTKEDFWENKSLPKRNSFKAMIELIDRLNDKPLTPSERSLIIAIRNAFGHNTYKVDLSQIRDVRHLPEVARGILKHLETLVG